MLPLQVKYPVRNHLPLCLLPLWHFHPNWSQYPGDTRFDLKPEITIDLQKLYIRGRGGGKNSKITAEKAYDILNETAIQYDWWQKMILSVPKIKSFFSNTPEIWKR